MRDHVFELRPGQLTVLAEVGDPEVDISIRDVGGVPLQERLDESDDLGDRFGGTRFEIGSTEPEGVRILEEPCRRLFRQLSARDPLLAGLEVDLVVDVGDVVDQRHLVAGRTKPAPKPHSEDERSRVPHVDSLVHG